MLHAYTLPFKKLNVFHQFKFQPHALQDDDDETNIVIAIPISHTSPSGQFDTIIALKTDDAKATGLRGESFHIGH